MRIKATIPNYDGSNINLSTGFQLSVFQGRELSTVQVEMRHRTQEGMELSDIWHAGLFMDYDDHGAGTQLLVCKSEAFHSKEEAVAALQDKNGVAVNFDPFVWMSHRKGRDNIHVIKAFGS